MKQLAISISFMATVLLLAGCATIVTKSIYPVNINSNPSEAAITIVDRNGNTVYTGTTPTTVSLRASAGFFRMAEYQVKFSKAGYNDRVVPIIFRLDNWYFGNLLLGGIIGMLIVDPASGAMWTLETEYLNETLTKEGEPATPEVRIMNIQDIPDSMKQHLVRIN